MVTFVAVEAPSIFLLSPYSRFYFLHISSKGKVCFWFSRICISAYFWVIGLVIRLFCIKGSLLPYFSCIWFANCNIILFSRRWTGLLITWIMVWGFLFSFCRVLLPRAYFPSESGNRKKKCVEAKASPFSNFWSECLQELNLSMDWSTFATI